ncbi:MAG TPA: DUF4157 domain-containing protein [Pyrinomonadaceae bacterium]|nr:DUF4157 domain-containing protein [Pyrinomonadaceae bacterium]
MSDSLRTETKAAETPSPARARTGLLQRKCACGGGSAGITGHCSECDEKRLTLQRSATGNDELRTIPHVVDEVISGAGQPLDSQARTRMESHLGHDFSRVRVHTDARAAESARAVSASAYTVGQQVVFASGKYQPQTSEGQRLLAHELTHVVQQSVGNLPGAQSAGDASESEADRNAESIGVTHGDGVHQSVRAGAIQRQPEARDEETEKILRAAGRAGREPDDQTSMMIRGSEITYRLISRYLPAYSDKLSGVGYDQRVKGVKAEKTGKDNISVTVGRDFILGTNADTLKMHVASVEQALRGSGVAPTVAAEKPAEAATQPAGAAKTEEAGTQVAPQGAWNPAYGKTPKTYVGVPYEEYKAGLGELRATTQGGVKGGAPGRGTKAAPEIKFDVLLQAFPGMAKDIAEDKTKDVANKKMGDREIQARAYLDSLNKAFKVMKIDTVEAQANYLAHAYAESDQFRQFIETQAWLNYAEDPAKRVDQKWITDPKKLRLDVGYLDRTYNPVLPTDPEERKKPEWVSAADRKRTVSPTGKPVFYGRGPVQVTHNYNYMEVVAMLEVAVESYEKEAAQPDISQEAKTEALKSAAFARKAANAVKADPEEAANPEYTFLISAAYMKKKRGDVTVADASPGQKWTGLDPGSNWVAGAKQTQKPQVKALKEKQGAYEKILPLLMCEAKKAGIEVDEKYSCP